MFKYRSIEAVLNIYYYYNFVRGFNSCTVGLLFEVFQTNEHVMPAFRIIRMFFI